MLKELVKLAEYFEANNLPEYAKQIDEILESIANETFDKPTENVDIVNNRE